MYFNISVPVYVSQDHKIPRGKFDVNKQASGISLNKNRGIFSLEIYRVQSIQINYFINQEIRFTHILNEEF